MCSRVAVACNGVQVFARRVAFVMVEAESRIGAVQLVHDAIARDFGHD